MMSPVKKSPAPSTHETARLQRHRVTDDRRGPLAVPMDALKINLFTAHGLHDDHDAVFPRKVEEPVVDDGGGDIGCVSSASPPEMGLRFADVALAIGLDPEDRLVLGRGDHDEARLAGGRSDKAQELVVALLGIQGPAAPEFLAVFEVVRAQVVSPVDQQLLFVSILVEDGGGVGVPRLMQGIAFPGDLPALFAGELVDRHDVGVLYLQAHLVERVADKQRS